MPRARIFATVDSQLAKEINLIYKVRCDSAKKNGNVKPDFSHTVEDLLRRGIRNTPMHGQAPDPSAH